MVKAMMWKPDPPVFDVAAKRSPASSARVLVWDRFVRLFHWSLAASVATTAATGFLAGATWADVHVVAGTVAVALVTARLVWGVLGPTHARFGDFLVGPRAVISHLREIAAGAPGRHRGHNPLGGWMIVALMFVVAGLAVTGVVVLGGVAKSGPLAFAVSFSTGWTVREWHEVMAFVLLGLVALHVVGAVAESLRSRENLVRAMIEGTKKARPDDHPSMTRTASPRLAVALVAIALAASGAVIATLAARPASGVPTAPLDPLYRAECGSCHTPYHPTLLPRESWRLVMAGLAEHFGDNATLDAATAGRLSAYLNANAAETADTKAANLLRRVDPAKPMEISATPFWRHVHRGIRDDVFASKAVGRPGACAACHADAETGRFRPTRIAIPKGVAR
jgi:cytochrome b